MMNQTENEFLDTYKSIEKICSDMYAVENGISEYISEMERKENAARFKIARWEETYFKLKRLRWLRNQLVHEVNPEECTKEDLEALKSFYNQLLSRQDPLAMLYRMEKTAPAGVSGLPGRNAGRERTVLSRKADRSRKPSAILWIFAAVVIVAIIVVAFGKR